MFFMKTKKRIKKLEEEYEQIQEDLKYIKDKLESSDDSDISMEILRINRHLESLNEHVKTLSLGSSKSKNESIDISALKAEIVREIDRKIVPTGVSESFVSNAIKDNNNNLLVQVRKLLESNQPSGNNSDIDYDRINAQIISAVQQAQSSDSRVVNLTNCLYAEIEKNKQLQMYADSLNQRIIALENAKSNQSNAASVDVDRGRTQKNAPVVRPININENTNAPVQHTEAAIVPIFSDNSLRNEKTVKAFLDNALELKEKYLSILSSGESDSIYIKTVDNCIKKLEKLYEKASDSQLEPSKLASEISKILSSTIIKNFVNPKLYTVIDEYLLSCKLVRKALQVGNKLCDDDYDYIGEMPLDVPVNNPEQHNVIMTKEHDAYIITFKDEEGLSRRIIEGKYSIGKYSK